MNGIMSQVIYLSSSAHSEWREPVKTQYRDDVRAVFVGPCEQHGLSDAMGSPGDLKSGHKLRITQMLSKSDILFCYIPDDHYRSFNVMLEIGIARAWGRRILLVNEARSLNGELKCVQPYVDESFDSLTAGLDRLHEYITGSEGLISRTSSMPVPEVEQRSVTPGILEHKVFLSGSNDSTWLDSVRARYRQNRAVKLIDSVDLSVLSRSDLLFACRTSGEGRLFNLPLAVGYASALNKRILFVNKGDCYSHAYDYIKPFSDGYFIELDEGLRFLDYAMGIEERL